MDESKLIFIVSQPRTGSTLLQKILSNNPQTNTVSEPWIMLALAPFLKPSAVTGIYDHELTIDALKDYVSKFNGVSILDEVRKFALRLYEPLFRGHEFVIDKTPRYWEIMDELLQLFPESKLIVVKRDPISVAKSIIRTWNVQSLEKLNYYKRDLLVAPSQIHAFCERNRSNPNVYVLRYEDLIQDIGSTMKQVYQWAGIEFKIEFLNADKNDKYKGKYGDPFQNAAGSYESERSKASKELKPVFEKFLKGYIHFLGKEFLMRYGNYKHDEKGTTTAFLYFEGLPFPSERSSLKKMTVQYFRKWLCS